MNRNETVLAAMTGIEPMARPYTTHRKTPKAKAAVVASEISLACRSRKIFRSWGSHAKVVMTAATAPMISNEGCKVVAFGKEPDC